MNRDEVLIAACCPQGLFRADACDVETDAAIASLLADGMLIEYADGSYHLRHHGRLHLEAISAPTPFGIERAREVWAQKGLEYDVTIAMTPGELAYVRKVLDSMSGGDRRWMDAFFAILQGKVPPSIG